MKKINLIIAVGKRKVKVSKQVLFEIYIGSQRSNVMTFVVLDLFTPVFLGLSWLRDCKMVIDCESNTLSTKEKGDVEIL